jgi:hypothetical protein
MSAVATDWGLCKLSALRVALLADDTGSLGGGSYDELNDPGGWSSEAFTGVWRILSE